MANDKKRQYIPHRTRKLLQKEIHNRCPFCDNVDVEDFEIHHIDGDRSNSIRENLIMLCSHCHTKIENGAISTEEVMNKKKVISSKRHYNEPSPQVEAAITAQILLQIDQLFLSDQSPQSSIADRLGRLRNYSEYANTIIADRVYNIISVEAQKTRQGIEIMDVLEIFLCLCEFYNPKQDTNIKDWIDIGARGVYTGFDIVYDAIKYLRSITIAQYGFLILNFYYKEAKRLNSDRLKKVVLEQLKSIENLNNSDKTSCQGNITILLDVYRKYLNESGLAFPVYPQHVMKTVDFENESSNTKTVAIAALTLDDRSCAWTNTDNFNLSVIRNPDSSLHPFPVFDVTLINTGSDIVILKAIELKVRSLESGISGLPRAELVKPIARYLLQVVQQGDKLVIPDPIAIPSQAPVRVQLELFQNTSVGKTPPTGRHLIRFVFHINENLKVMSKVIRLNTECDDDFLQISVVG